MAGNLKNQHSVLLSQDDCSILRAEHDQVSLLISLTPWNLEHMHCWRNVFRFRGDGS